jgi:hypothetical protein
MVSLAMLPSHRMAGFTVGIDLTSEPCQRGLPPGIVLCPLPVELSAPAEVNP